MTVEHHFEHSHYSELNDISLFNNSFDYQLSHIHSDMEIDMVSEGSFWVRTNDEIYLAKEGDILVFNPFKPHEFIGLNNSCQLLTLHLKKGFCRNYFPQFKHVFFTYSRILEQENTSALAELHACLLHLYDSYLKQNFGFELDCYSDLNRILFLLLKIMPYKLHTEEDAAVNGKFQGRLERILNYIEAHYRQKISLSEIAREEQLSTSYLSHFFKEHLNMSFQDYVNLLRFEAAVQLLIQTDQKLVDICMECGFSESKYFNKLFLEKYGMKPKEFRKLVNNRKPTEFSHIKTP